MESGYYIHQDWLPYNYDPETATSQQGDWKKEYWDNTANQAYHFWFYVEVAFHDGPEWAYTANEVHDGGLGKGGGVSQEDYDLAIKGIDFGWGLFGANMLSLFSCDNS